MQFCVEGSLFWTIALFAAGLLLICLSGDRFVDASVVIAKRLKIPQIVVGATIVSIGTTLPEVLVSATAALQGSADIAIGNSFGSIICNTALIAGVGQLISPAKSVKTKSVVWRILVFLAAALFVFATGLIAGRIGRIAGVVMLLLFALYGVLSVKIPDDEVSEGDIENERLPKTWVAVVTLFACAAFLYVGAKLLVDNGQVLALDYLGVPERIVAVTLIALGTSLPELVTTVTSAIKKQGDVGIGNIIGANIFNLLLVISIPAAVTGNVPTSNEALYTDLPIATGLMVLFAGWMLIAKKGSRILGLLLVLAYVAYSLISFM